LTIPVTNITGAPNTAIAKTSLTLAGTVVPSDATFQTIVWSVQSAGTTGATINGAILNTTYEGTVTVTATIVNGMSVGSNYTQNFSITVHPEFVPVTNITGVPTSTKAITPLTLIGTVVPENATNKTIVWSVQNTGTTGATVSGNTLNTTAGGTVSVLATITNGASASSNYMQYFNIIVSAVTGTEDLFAPNLKIYPNPFTGLVRIAGAEGCTLQVITEAGAVVHTQKITNPDETIRLEHLPAGVYFFRMEKDGKTKTEKVVKEW
jgi:hypothetical protein